MVPGGQAGWVIVRLVHAAVRALVAPRTEAVDCAEGHAADAAGDAAAQAARGSMADAASQPTRRSEHPCSRPAYQGGESAPLSSNDKMKAKTGNNME